MSLVYQFGRFLGVGIIGLLVLLVATYVLTEAFYLWYFFAYVLGTLVSWTCIFLMNSIFTFRGHDRTKYGTKYLSFLAMYVGAFAVNSGIVYTLTSLTGFYYLFSITIATIVTTAITFTLSKTLIFTYGPQD